MQIFLLGLLIVGLIGLIPIVRGLFLLVVNIFGLGAILKWQLGKVKTQIIS